MHENYSIKPQEEQEEVTTGGKRASHNLQRQESQRNFLRCYRRRGEGGIRRRKKVVF